jgi:polyphenol oxidase
MVFHRGKDMIITKDSNITYFCTTRDGGVSEGNYSSLNLSEFTGDNFSSVNQNRQIIRKALGAENLQLVIPHQTHSTEVRIIDTTFNNLTDELRVEFLDEVDALVTALPGVCVAVTTADCVPITYFDGVKKIVAVAHAGWRGTCRRIAKNVVEVMVREFGCNPSDIHIFIGPSISPEVYEVGSDVVQEFDKAEFILPEIISRKGEKYLLDLWQANVQVLTSCGIPRKNIKISGECTYTQQEKYFSARRLGIHSGRILSGAYISA